MASSFFDLLTQSQPNVKTRQALLVLGLQNDLVASDGKLPVSGSSEFVDKIKRLAPVFRENAGDVIWVRTEYLQDRSVNDTSGDGDMVLVDAADGADSPDEDSADDAMKALPQISPGKPRSSRHGRRALDLLKRVSAKKRTARAPSPLLAAPPPPDEEELFLSRTPQKSPACVSSTPGWEFHPDIKATLEDSADLVLSTSHYSAFNSTNLLVILRAKLITELYICGCLTNVSVYATALDAARHGLSIYLLEDCLAYRKISRHEEALRQMNEVMGAQITTSSDIINQLLNPGEIEVDSRPGGADDLDVEQELNQLVSNLKINEKSSKSAAALASKNSKSGRRAVISDVVQVDNDDKEDAPPPPQPKPSQKAPDRASEPKPSLVKSKIRMRHRSKNESKANGEKLPENSRPRTSASIEESPPPPAASQTASPKAAAAATAASSTKEPQSPSKKDHALKMAKSQPSLANSSPSTKAPKSSSSFSSLTRPKSLGILSSSKTSSTPNNPKSDNSTRPSSLSAMGKKATQSLATFPTLGPKDSIGEGDSRIVHDFFPDSLIQSRRSSKPVKDEVFNWLLDEVHWQKMYHAQGEVPRLVCVQGQFGKDGSMPVYRHPSDQSLPLLHFSPTVQLVRETVEKLVNHPVNHVLIQLYRSGNDYISEHSDKTLDIVRGSSIVNVSFGAQRTMRLRTKRSAKDGSCTESGEPSTDSKDPVARNTQRIHMPHNSMFVLGQETNKRWLHGINADRRRLEERSEPEKAYSGMRISLTFRHIGTYLDSESKTVWGQGATAKDRSDANEVINDDEAETEKIIHAFGTENQSTEFDWDKVYGAGFDVLHFRSAPADHPIFFSSNDSIETRQVALCLAELGLGYTVCEPLQQSDQEGHNERSKEVCFRDVDVHHTEVSGAVTILFYLDRYYHLDRSESGKVVSAAAYPALLKLAELKRSWTHREITKTAIQNMTEILHALDELMTLHQGDYIAGNRFSIADCAAWPVLDVIIEGWADWQKSTFPALTAYYEQLWAKRKHIGKLRKNLPPQLSS